MIFRLLGVKIVIIHILSDAQQILKSSLRKYEVAELHIEHYTYISFHAIFILTCAFLIKYIY